MVESCNLIAQQNEQTLQNETKSHQVLYFGIICVLAIRFQFVPMAGNRTGYISFFRESSRPQYKLPSYKITN